MASSTDAQATVPVNVLASASAAVLSSADPYLSSLQFSGQRRRDLFARMAASTDVRHCPVPAFTPDLRIVSTLPVSAPARSARGGGINQFGRVFWG